MTPLRQQMIDAMSQRGFSPKTHKSYLRAIRGLACYFQYLQADLKMKGQALAALQSPTMASMRYQPSNDILAFLDGL